MLIKYDIMDSIPFSFKYSSKHDNVLTLVEKIWQNLAIDKTKKIHLKKECLLSTILSLRLGYLTCNYTRYSRRREHYSNYPYRYKPDYYTYEIMCNVISGLEKLGLVESELGFKNPEDGFSVLTKIRASDSFIKELQKISNPIVENIPPPELVVLRKRGAKTKINYKDTTNTKQMRHELTEYNELRQHTTFALQNVSEVNFENKHTMFLRQFSLSKGYPNVVSLSNPYIYRSFSGSFKRGGRFYAGIESNMPKNFRQRLLINGSKTVEKDFSCMHINMLYNFKNKKLVGDAYDPLTNGDPIRRKIFKFVGLVSINANSLEKAIDGIRNQLLRNKLYKYQSLTNESILILIEQWKKCHNGISQYLLTDTGGLLQYTDSKIAAAIIKYFTKKCIPILVVHDSFLIEEKYESELIDVMMMEYKKILKYEVKVC